MRPERGLKSRNTARAAADAREDTFWDAARKKIKQNKNNSMTK